MTEFVALKPKMYSFKTTASELPHNTLKGIPAYRRKQLTFEQYYDVLQKSDLVSTTTTRLQFINKHMTMYQQRKLALSPYEDKRYYINAMDSVAYGHDLCGSSGGNNNSNLTEEAAGSNNRKNFIFLIIMYIYIHSKTSFLYLYLYSYIYIYLYIPHMYVYILYLFTFY